MTPMVERTIDVNTQGDLLETTPVKLLLPDQISKNDDEQTEKEHFLLRQAKMSTRGRHPASLPLPPTALCGNVPVL